MKIYCLPIQYFSHFTIFILFVSKILLFKFLYIRLLFAIFPFNNCFFKSILNRYLKSKLKESLRIKYNKKHVKILRKDYMKSDCKYWQINTKRKEIINE